MGNDRYARRIDSLRKGFQQLIKDDNARFVIRTACKVLEELAEDVIDLVNDDEQSIINNFTSELTDLTSYNQRYKSYDHEIRVFEDELDTISENLEDAGNKIREITNNYKDKNIADRLLDEFNELYDKIMEEEEDLGYRKYISWDKLRRRYSSKQEKITRWILKVTERDDYYI